MPPDCDPDEGSEPDDNDFSFIARLERGYRQIQSLNRDQLERFLPYLPVVKICKGGGLRSAEMMTQNVERFAPKHVESFLPLGFERFVKSAPSPRKIGIKREKNAQLLLTSRTVRREVGGSFLPEGHERQLQIEGPATETTICLSSVFASEVIAKNEKSFAPTPPLKRKGTAPQGNAARSSVREAAGCQPSPPALPISDHKTLMKLYENNDSTPSERIGGFYSHQLGSNSPIRIHLTLAGRRTHNGSGKTRQSNGTNSASVFSGDWSRPIGVNLVPQPPPPPPPPPTLLLENASAQPDFDLDQELMDKINLYDRLEGSLPLELFDEEQNYSNVPALFLRNDDREEGGIAWVPCLVCERDPVTLFYNTLIDKAGGQDARQVSRYQLRFEWETVESFTQRVVELKALRRSAERVVRTDLFLSLMEDDEERGLDSAVLANTLQKTAKRLHKRWEGRVKQYIDQIAEEHFLALRRARLQYFLLSPKFLHQITPIDMCTDLQIAYPIKYPPLEPDQTRRARFLNAKSFLAKHPQFCISTFKTLVKMAEVWAPYEDLLLVSITKKMHMSTTIYNMLIGFDAFCALQKTHSQGVVKNKINRWMIDVEGVLLSSLKQKFKSNYTSESAYRASDLSKFLRGVNFRMCQSLRQVVANSLQKLVEFFENMVGTADDVTAMRGGDTTWTNHYYDLVGLPPSRPVKDAPLLVLELTVTSGIIGFDTPLAELQTKVVDVIHHVARSVSRLSTVEKTFLSSLDLPERYIDLHEDDIVRSATNRTVILMQKCLPYLEALLKVYAPFEYLLREHDENPETVFQDLSTTRLAVAKIESLFELKGRVLNCTPDTVFCLFVVDCAGIKKLLAERVSSLIDLYLNVASEKVVGTTLAASALYNRLWTEIQLRPTTPESHASFKVNTFKMRSALEKVESDDFKRVMLWRSDVLDRFNRGLKDSEADEVFKMQEWPMKIRDSLSNSDVLLVQEEKQFIVQLECDRRNLQKDLKTYTIMVEELSQISDSELTDVAAEKAQKLQDLLQDSLRRSVQCQRHEQIFGLPASTWGEIKLLLAKSLPFYKLWKTAFLWTEEQSRCFETPIQSLDTTKLRQCISQWHRETRVSQRALRGYPGPSEAAQRLGRELSVFHNHLPWVTQLTGEGIRVRHWKQLIAELGCPRSADITIALLIENGIESKRAFVTSLAEQAAKEAEVDLTIERMKMEWKDQKMWFVEWSGCKIIHIAHAQELLMILDKHIASTQVLRLACLQAFENIARDWEAQLVLLQDILTNWISLQETWANLKPVFDNADVCVGLGRETKRFLKSHKVWCALMKEGEFSARLISLGDEFLQRVVEVHAQLVDVQKGLATFLQVKRNAWPRLYWLPDEAILQMLAASGADLSSVDEYLPQCLGNVSKLITDDRKAITAVETLSEEHLTLRYEVHTVGRPLDEWLSSLDKTITETLIASFPTCVQEHSSLGMREWVERWSAQLLLLCLKVTEHRDIKDLLEVTGKRGLSALHKKLRNVVSDITVLFDHEDGGGTESFVTVMHKDDAKSQANKQQYAVVNNRILYEAMAMQHMATRDKVTDLIEEECETTSDFCYAYTMKHILNEQGVTTVDILHVSHPYRFECLGMSSPYVTCSASGRAKRLIFFAFAGSFPQPVLLHGTAGCGKYHLLKDLATEVGMKCVSQCCSQGTTWRSISNTIAGAISSGAWCVLLKINELTPATTSSLATALDNIYTQVALKSEGVDLFNWGRVDTDADCKQSATGGVALHKSFVISGVQSTLPHGTALDHSFRTLFRPVSLVKPDLGLIATYKLFISGLFTHAEEFGPRLMTILAKCTGIIALPPPLVLLQHICACVVLRSGARVYLDDADTTAEAQEFRIFSIACYVCVKKVVSLFEFDIFSKTFEVCFGKGPFVHESRTAIPQATYSTLNASIGSELVQKDDKRYIMTPSIVAKLHDLHDTLSLHSCVIIVGKTGCGKTMLTDVLSQCLQDKDDLTTHSIVHGSMPISTLQGRIREGGRWEMGLLPNIFRKAHKSVKTWLIFDGPLGDITERFTSLWSPSADFTTPQPWENRQKQLTPVNYYECISGERISVPNSLKHFFECQDMDNANPFIVTHSSLLYFGDHKEWRAVLKGALLEIASPFARSTVDDFLPQLISFAEVVILPCVEFFEHAEFVVPIHTHVLMRRIVHIFHAVVESQRIYPDGAEALHGSVEVPLVHALCSVVYESLAERHKTLFSESLWKWMPSWSAQLIASLPHEALPMECYVDEGRWSKLTHHPMIESSFMSYQGDYTTKDYLLPSVDALRIWHHQEILTAIGVPFAISGGASTGKTRLLHRLSKRMQTTGLLVFCSISRGCSASGFQQSVALKMTRRRSVVLGPPLGKKCVIVVDDLHLASTATHENEGGSLHELLVSVLKCKKWCDPGGVVITIADTSFLGSFQAGEENSERLFSHFVIGHCVNEISEGFVGQVISNIIMGWKGASSYNLAASVTDVLLRCHAFLRASFEPRSDNFFIWSVEDLFAIVRSVVSHPSQSCAKSHHVLSLLVYEMYARVARFQTLEQLRMTDAKVLEIVSSEMHVQFADTALRPSQLSFTVVEKGGLSAYSQQISLENLIKNVQSHADELHLKYVEDTATATPEASKKKNKRAKRKTEPEKKTAIQKLRVLSRYIRLRGLCVDSTLAVLVSKVAGVISQPKGHGLIATDQGDAAFTAVQVASHAAGYVCIGDSERSNTTWCSVLEHIFGVALESSTGVTWVLHDYLLCEEQISDIALMVSSADLCGLISVALHQRLSRKLLDSSGGELNKKRELIADKVSNMVHIVLLCNADVNDTDKMALMKRRFPAIFHATTCIVVKDYSISRTACVAYVHSLCRMYSQRNLFQITKSVLDRVAEALYEVFKEIVALRPEVRISHFRLLARTFCNLLAKACDTVLANSREYGRVLELVECVAMQGKKCVEDVNYLITVLQDLDTQRASLLESEASWLATEQEKQAAFEELESSCFKRVEEHARTREECKLLLAVAVPALESAKQGLLLITEKDLAAIRCVNSPAPVVKKVMEAICIVLNEKVDILTRTGGGAGWAVSQQCLTDPSFLSKLININPRKLSPKVAAQLRAYVTHSTFKVEKAKSTNLVAIEKLCIFAQKLEEYLTTVATVQPKQEILEKDDATIKVLVNALDAKRDCAVMARHELEAVQNKLNILSSRYTQISERIDNCKLHSTNADFFSKHVEATATRWRKEFCSHTDDEAVAGITVCAAYHSVFYASAVGMMLIERKDLLATVAEHLYVPATHNTDAKAPIGLLEEGLMKDVNADAEPQEVFAELDVEDALFMRRRIQRWVDLGVLKDVLSLRESVAVAVTTVLTPFFANPHGAAETWLAAAYPGISHLRGSSPLTLGTIELCMTCGVPVYVETDSLPPTFLPLFRVIEQGYGKIGNRDIKIRKGFRLFFVKTCSSFELAEFLKGVQTDVADYVIPLSFVLPREELRADICKAVSESISCEISDEIDTLKSKVNIAFNHYEQVSNKLLKALKENATKENVWTPDGDAIASLPTADLDIPLGEVQQTSKLLRDSDLMKNLTTEVKAVETALSNVSQELEAKREYEAKLLTRFEGLVTLVELVYTALDRMASLNSLYKMGFAFLMKIVRREIRSLSEQKGERVSTKWGDEAEGFAKDMLSVLFKVVAAGLPQTHRTVYAFLICIDLDRLNDVISQQEWDLFIAPLNEVKPDRNAKRCHIEHAIHLAKAHACFRDLPSAIEKRFHAWVPFLEGLADPPMMWKGFLSQFQLLILVKYMSPASLPRATLNYCCCFISMLRHSHSVLSVFRDALFSRGIRPTYPILLLHGGDANSAREELKNIASQTGGCKVIVVPYSPEKGHTARVQGFIRNCDTQDRTADRDALWLLISDFDKYKASEMETISSMISESRTDSPDARFRVFFEVHLDEHEHIPISLTRVSIKLLSPSPPCLKSTIIKHLDIGPITRQVFSSEEHCDTYHQTLRMVSIIHGVLTYRRRVGVPYGWLYGESHFGDLDARAVVAQLDEHQRKGQGFPQPSTLLSFLPRIVSEMYGSGTQEIRTIVQLADRITAAFLKDDSSQWSATAGGHTKQTVLAGKLPSAAPPGVYGLAPPVERVAVTHEVSLLLQLTTEHAGGVFCQREAAPPQHRIKMGLAIIKTRLEERPEEEEEEVEEEVEEAGFCEINLNDGGASGREYSLSFLRNDYKDFAQQKTSIFHNLLQFETTIAVPSCLRHTDGKGTKSYAGATQRDMEDIVRYKEKCLFVDQVRAMQRNFTLHNAGIDEPEWASYTGIPRAVQKHLPPNALVFTKETSLAGLIAVYEKKMAFLLGWTSSSIWLPGLSFPNTVLSVFLDTNVYDDANLFGRINSDTKTAAPLSVTVGGLTLHNAALDQHKCIQSAVSGTSLVALPVSLELFVETTQKDVSYSQIPLVLCREVADPQLFSDAKVDHLLSVLLPVESDGKAASADGFSLDENQGLHIPFIASPFH